MMQTGYCKGTIMHQRIKPKVHRFKYNMSWALFDLDELQSVSDKNIFFSLNRFNLISIKTKDYINSENKSLKTKACELIEERTGKKFGGKIILFTHPRYLGFEFNSVSFYFCYEGNDLKYILSEINNTPWNEKHIYLHDLNKCDEKRTSDLHTFRFRKQFHISPFADMDIDYNWRFKITSETLFVAMDLYQNKNKIMNVVLDTVMIPVGNKGFSAWALSRPFQSLKMFSGIYWHALRLWLKKIPFYYHPKIKEKEL
ncbi:MAG TPA: DUF1365 domain-containing protein [Gammaproteobacteria bacterium]|nr:DUF1365 domain-containing protein [Xanthomonadales bacterium]MCB1594863.1 DUF1365 domain-containing protein [Xanthomonadales bacterium]HOP21348.1 DUF1365 domain-containing protein [Gammaproteobacteria bacterium]HPI94792.1 DUF1365 domain-containing protein [Gammaproteobacteria bacterium]